MYCRWSIIDAPLRSLIVDVRSPSPIDRSTVGYHRSPAVIDHRPSVTIIDDRHTRPGSLGGQQHGPIQPGSQWADNAQLDTLGRAVRCAHSPAFRARSWLSRGFSNGGGGEMSSRREHELPTQSSSGLTRFEQIADAHSVLAEHAAAPEPEFGPWRHRHSSASRRAC